MTETCPACRARRSPWPRMSTLMLHFTNGVPERPIAGFLRRVAGIKHDVPPLGTPEENLAVDHDEVYATVRRWARRVLAARAPHHAAFRGLIGEVGA
ncbi:MAG: hypothetical protein ACU0DK_08080 [Pseudooceanicola sp.]